MHTSDTLDAAFRTHDSGFGLRAQIPTQSGKFNLSIIAGEFYYSTPREDGHKAKNYTAFELAIFDRNQNWAKCSELKEAGVFEILEDEGEYKEGVDVDSAVFGWVSREKIIELLNKA